MKFFKILLFTLWVFSPLVVHAVPKVAVPALAYEDQVRGYFTETYLEYEEHSKYDRNNDDRKKNRSRDVEYTQITQYETKINRGHLRKFVNDVKGKLIKSKKYGVVATKSAAEVENSQQLYDILARIKKGDFKHADFVLFGTISAVDIQDQVNEMSGSRSFSLILEMQVVVDFSMINTRTNDVIASFSAIGEGSDVKLIKHGSRVKPSIARVIRGVSKSLAEDVMVNIEDQTL